MPNETWQSDFTHYRLTRPDGRPGADVEIISWLDDCTRYALHVTAHARVTAPIVLATFREAADLHGYPASTLTDNGMVYTVRLAGHGRQGGRNAFESELRRLGHRPEELPTQPPHHLRQGRTVPADDEEVAARPARPADHHRRAADPPRPLPRRVQPPPTAPLAAPPRHPGHRLHGPPQGHPRRRPRHRHPRPGPPRQRSTKPAPSPCASPADSATSASAEPTPEPTSSCSSRTSTSASSTPPPANSSANSPSTPAATTSPPETTQDPPGNEQHPDLRFVGPGCRRCPETSHGRADRI